MSIVFIVAVVFASIVIVLAIICGTVLMGMKLRHGGLSPKDRQEHADEVRMIQEIYQSLSKMEERVESLETILMERYGKDRVHE